MNNYVAIEYISDVGIQIALSENYIIFVYFSFLQNFKWSKINSYVIINRLNSSFWSLK